MSTLEERVAALEAVAERCSIPGCKAFARQHLCLSHEAAWNAYADAKEHHVGINFVGEVTQFGPPKWSLVYLNWLDSIGARKGA